jgi:hypothetical protein
MQYDSSWSVPLCPPFSHPKPLVTSVGAAFSRTGEIQARGSDIELPRAMARIPLLGKVRPSLQEKLDLHPHALGRRFEEAPHLCSFTEHLTCAQTRHQVLAGAAGYGGERDNGLVRRLT